MPLYFAERHEQFLSHCVVDHDDNAGGVVTFLGTVRKFNHGKEVQFLDYEAATELAACIFSEIEERAQKQFGLLSTHAVHRLARVDVGQEAVFIRVLAKHRHEAFIGARFLIDELKRTVPIWKKEVYSDGTSSYDQGHCRCTFDEAIADAILEPSKRALLAQGIAPEMLAHKHVVLVGAGGLGCPLAVYLGALGVKLTIIDGDTVDHANLARQFAYRVVDQGFFKAELLRDFLMQRGLSQVSSIAQFVDDKKIDLLLNADVVIDATDHPATKALLRSLAHQHQFALVSASVHQHDGEVQVFVPGSEGCLLCFAPDPLSAYDSCTRIGVLAHVCNLVASVASDRVLACLVGAHKARSEVTIVDPNNGLRRIKVVRDPFCTNCAPRTRRNLIQLVRPLR